MIFNIQVHPDVQKDYEEAYSQYEDQSEGLGENFLAAVRKKLEAIAASPENYSAKSRKNYREAKIRGFPFVIVYNCYLDKNVVFVSSVHHMKKHPKKKFRK